MPLSTHTRKDLAAEAHRELRQRAGVYPRLIERGKLNRDRAGLHYRRMAAIADLLDHLTDREYLDLTARVLERKAAAGVQGKLL